MSSHNIIKTKHNIARTWLPAVLFALASIVLPPEIQMASATQAALPPYGNYFGFPVPWGGCDNGNTWCDTFDPITGMMHLSDFPFSGQYDESFVEWNTNPVWGDSPTAYYTWKSPVYWGTTWDAVGSIVQKAWPFYGQMIVGGMLLECADTTPGCTGGQYNYDGFLGVGLTSNDVNGKVDYQFQSSSDQVYQDADHLYTLIPVGYTGAYANNCENSCYGAGYTDFGQGSNYLLVRDVYGFPEE